MFSQHIVVVLAQATSSTSRSLIAGQCEWHRHGLHAIVKGAYVFVRADVLEDPCELSAFDFVVMNGVLTEKREVSHEEMEHYARTLLRQIWPHVRRGLAFNVMSP